MKKAIDCGLAVCVVLVLALVYAKAQNAGVAVQSAVPSVDTPPAVALTRDLTIAYEVQTLAYGKRMQKRRDTFIHRPNGNTAGMSDTSDGDFIGSFHKMGSGKLVSYDSRSRVAFEESPPGLEDRPRMNGRDICGKYECFGNSDEILGYKTVKAVLKQRTSIHRVGETTVNTFWMAPELNYATLKYAKTVDGQLTEGLTAISVSRDPAPESLFSAEGMRVVTSRSSFNEAIAQARGISVGQLPDLGWTDIRE